MVDHKAEAEGSLGILNGAEYTGSDGEAMIAAAIAQAHATLYLAEQTRVQNILLYNSVGLQVDLYSHVADEVEGFLRG